MILLQHSLKFLSNQLCFLFSSFDLLQILMKLLSVKALHSTWISWGCDFLLLWHDTQLFLENCTSRSPTIVSPPDYQSDFSSILQITVWAFCPWFLSFSLLHILSVWSHQQIQNQLSSVCQWLTGILVYSRLISLCPNWKLRLPFQHIMCMLPTAPTHHG